tara:strand:- start:215 stop:550 length:336 start_codon:yes stop_codon:yes gene_type:complete
MSVLLRLVFIANLIDAYLTLVWINAGVATETNPIMNFLLQQGSGWFLTVKITSVFAACLILWRMRNISSVYVATRLVSLLAVFGYAVLIGFHIVGAYNVGALHLALDFLNF